MRTTVDLRQVTRVIKFVLRICGLWKPSSGSRWTIAYAIYGILFLTTFSGFFTLCMCINLFFIPDLKELTVASYMSLTELALFVKIVYFFILNRKLQKLFGELDEFALEHEWEQNLVRERVQYFFKIMAFYYAVSNGAVSVTEIGSALTPEPKLSYSGWYPYLDWQTNRRDFWIVFGYQCLGMRSTCNMNVTIDSFACFFMFMISVQMEILGKRLNNMGHEKILVNANKTDYEDRTWYIRRLINQIKLHQKMIASTKSFERYFSMAFFTQISFSGMVICSLTNELAHTSPISDFGQYISYMMLLMALMTQIFLLCYFGNELIIKSEELSTDIFGSNWPEITAKDQQLKSTMIVFQERLKRKTQVLVLILFPFSLDTFTKVLNLAYRLFALLQNV